MKENYNGISNIQYSFIVFNSIHIRCRRWFWENRHLHKNCILRSEMLPGINWVTGMWVQRHCLLRECSGGAEVCTPRPLWRLQRSRGWNTHLLLYNWGVTRAKCQLQMSCFLRCNKDTEVADGHGTALFMLGFLGVILGGFLVIAVSCYICQKYLCFIY